MARRHTILKQKKKHEGTDSMLKQRKNNLNGFVLVALEQKFDLVLNSGITGNELQILLNMFHVWLSGSPSI